MTVGTTTLLGMLHYVEFAGDFGTRPVLREIESLGFLDQWSRLFATFGRQALGYSAAILGILGAHEMGHYLVCRRYNVDATLPFFIPFPSWAGTLGAVIRIREPFPSRKALFDIAIGGPIAGFVVLVPLLFWGMHHSRVLPMPPFPPDVQVFWLGEPLLFRLAKWWAFGPIPAGSDVSMHPIAFAAWFGMLATSWNLLPFGQLDGGHLAHATLGERSRDVSLLTIGLLVGLCFVSLSWIVMTAMLLAMLYLLGPRHPPPLICEDSLGAGRRWLTIFAIVMFVLCFTPAPINPMN